MLELILVVLVIPTVVLIYAMHVWTLTGKFNVYPPSTRAVQAILIICLPFLGALLVHPHHNANTVTRRSKGAE